MKKCAKCKEDKSEEFFYKKKNYKNGLSSTCKDCEKAYHANKYVHNKERIAKRNAEWVKSNKEKKSAINKASVERNREKRNEQTRLYKKKNKGAVNARNALRRSIKLNATPPWLSSAQEAHIKRIYKLCQIISDATGEKYHVDHIVPLQGKNVCGLHVPWNLRAVPAKINLSKSNKHDYLPIEHPD